MSRGCFLQPVAASRQYGLTLVEVMVAMTIGIILLLALGTLFANSTRVFKVSDEFARMQENGAFALHAIGSDLRQAGFYGLITSTDVQMPVAIVVTDDCGADWAVNVAQPLFGMHGLTDSAAHTALDCINAANFISTSTDRPSFILVVRGATGARVLPADLEVGTLYVQSDPNGGILFQGSQFASLGKPPRRELLSVPSAPLYAPASGTLMDPIDAPIYPYQSRAYYLRPCARPTGGTSDAPLCTATDDGGQPIPTLVRQELVGTRMRERAVAEGIEAVRILYGIDTNNDGVADPPLTETPTATQFAQVVTVRVSLLVRSPRPSNGYSDATRRYDLDGDGAAELNCADAGLPCNYHRHVFTQTFQVRNSAQRFESS